MQLQQELSSLGTKVAAMASGGAAAAPQVRPAAHSRGSLCRLCVTCCCCSRRSLGRAARSSDRSRPVRTAVASTATSPTALNRPQPPAAAPAAPRRQARQRVEKLSAEVVDSNPYSRLMALQRMGIVKDYEQIRGKTVSASAEHERLERCC